MAQGYFPQALLTLCLPARDSPEQRKHGSIGCRCGVVDQELHRIAAAPGVATQMAGDVDSGTTRFAKELAERGPDGPERDGSQPSRVERIGQCAAQMTAPDEFGMRYAHAGQGEAGLRIAGPERRQPVDVADQFGLSGAERKRYINPQFGDQPLPIEPVAQPLD